MTETPSNWVEGRTLPASSDVFALEWLGANGVLAAGCRNGSVRVYDPRGKKMAGMEVWHGSAVVGVRAVDEWRVVVAGLESRVGVVFPGGLLPSLFLFFSRGFIEDRGLEGGAPDCNHELTVVFCTAEHVRPPLRQIPTSSAPRTPSFASLHHYAHPSPLLSPTTTTTTTNDKTAINPPPHLPPPPEPAHANPRLRHRHPSQPRRGRYFRSSIFFRLFLLFVFSQRQRQRQR